MTDNYYSNLLAGDSNIVTQPETILTGQDVVEGTVMGKITASGKLVIVNSANSDGSENPYAIMAQDTDASAADVVAITYHAGQFNENELVFGGTDTIVTHRTAMRLLAMHAKPSVLTTGIQP